MKRIKKVILNATALIVYVMTALFAQKASAEVPEGGYQTFTNLFRTSYDVVYSDMSFGEKRWSRTIAKVQSLVAEEGWTTGQVVEALSYIVTNGVPAGTKRWSGPLQNSLVFDKSLSMLPIIGGTNALPAIEYVIDRQNPLVSVSAFSKYATVLGFGHDAFSRYAEKLSGPSNLDYSDRWTSFYRIQEVFEKIPRTNAETNRIVALLMHVANEYKMYPWSAKKFDWHACTLWPGYSTSSNRLEYIDLHFADDMPSKASNYFANARAELLALPPGTMQMLPTNQFYNVDD